MRSYEVFMHSKHAMGRTFYAGSVRVRAESEDEAEDRAITKAAAVHGHREWVIERVET